MTLPIGGRIALPSSINTYISVLKNTSLMTAIGFQRADGNVALDLRVELPRRGDAELVAVVYLVLVWSLSGGIRLLERRLASRGAR